MQSQTHSLNALFEQLGLKPDDGSVDRFITEYKPLPRNVVLYEAGFWNKSQADFLKQAIEDDADWAIVVDQLDLMLR